MPSIPALAGALLCAPLTMPAHAQSITHEGNTIQCSYIRTLTKAERTYFVWRFSITREQQLQIRVKCKLDIHRKS